MTAFWKLSGALLAALVLASCTNKITSEVTRFHTLAAPAGETVRIVPKDADKQNSLEFKEYAQMIGDQLGAVGFRPAEPGATPDLEVRIDYEVGEGQEMTRRYGGYPGYGHFGGYGRFGHFGHFGHYGGYGYGGYGYPYYGGYGEGQSITVYPRKLEMDIVRESTSEMVFEGVVDSIGRNKHLNEVMYFLVQAMFDGFPGEHGATHKVTIEIPDKQASNN